MNISRTIIIMTILITEMIPSFGQKNIVKYYNSDGNIVSQKKAVYFTINNKVNDTCWSLDYYLMNGPLAKREQYKEKENRIKNGQFSYYHFDGRIDSSGFFLNGSQNGKWVAYSKTFSVVQEKTYQEGILVQTKDYPHDSLLKIPVDSSGIESQFPGGIKGWYDYMSRNLKIPDEVINGVGPVKNGNVIVGFTVDTDGNILDIVLLKSSLYQLNEVAIDLIKKSPKWIPASRNGINVKSYKRQPINFSW